MLRSARLFSDKQHLTANGIQAALWITLWITIGWTIVGTALYLTGHTGLPAPTWMVGLKKAGPHSLPLR